ncbi:MAG: alpha/beta fold hydrolase [Bacteroidetes bacterium]|nr:alpha/beta fold hydrolase [Bacteroidota bacterium]
MKKTGSIFFLFILISMGLSAQTITGDWYGTLTLQGIKLRIIFHITEAEGALSATLDSPDQGAKGLPVSEITFMDNLLSIKMPNLMLEYSGKPNEDFIIIEGNFKQGGLNMPLNLSRENEERQTFKRPQEPEKPYPYYEEEVTFKNERADIELAGTLTLPSPEGQHPVAILITGSGAQNRDEELLGHKPFLVIADYLTRKGVGVLRYDDRGVDKSTGDFGTATTADFATDVAAAVAYLKTRKEVKIDQIGLIGHSEGGMIAPMVASKSEEVSFVILLAGPGVPITELMAKQLELISLAQGESKESVQEDLEVMGKAYEMIKKSKDIEKLKIELADYFELEYEKASPEDQANLGEKEVFIPETVKTLTTPWFIYFMKFDPSPYLKMTKCPVLAVNGEKDLQVDAMQNLGGIQTALRAGGNNQFVIKEFPNLNHLFQNCETGAPSEYAQIEETFSEEVLKVMADWIMKMTE